MVRGGLSFGEHMIENACMGASSTCRPEQAKRHTVTEAVLAHDVFKSAFSRQWQCENKKICFSPHTLPRRLGELTATFGSAGISAVYNSVQTTALCGLRAAPTSKPLKCPSALYESSCMALQASQRFSFVGSSCPDSSWLQYCLPGYS